jgi:stage VI sporulation protein D
MVRSHYVKGGNNLSQQTSGLRFDIYERVHLPENTVGMRELNGIELTPEISVVAQGEQAVLKGHLVLSGTYTGEDETRSEEQLTHRIPVEITLPLNRIENVNDIRVEIENFDVDLLSSRSLNVTGVLSLGGIEMVSTAEADWREEEQVVFTHRVEESAPSAPAPNLAADTVISAEEAPNAPLSPLSAVAEGIEVLHEAANEAPAEALADAVLEDAKPEKQEIKIAFAGKSAEALEQAPLDVNAIMSMAGAPPAEKRKETPSNEAAAVAAAAEAAEARDRLEWKKLFLQASTEEPTFRKVRMCIAQKEDTIETIADRYNKNARELALYNRINEEYVQEGQVVYIP